MAAFQGAVDLGYQYLETDLHATRDGVLVTIHDYTLDRTTDGSGWVSECTLQEVKRLDAGYRFSPDGDQTFPFRGKGLTVPTFAEVVEAFPQVRLNVDLKDEGPPGVERLASFIEEHHLHDRILAACSQTKVIEEFRRRTGDRVATPSTNSEATRFWFASRLGLTKFLRCPYDALQVPPRRGRLTVVDRCFVRAAHRRGLQVHVWTVDEPDEMRHLLDLGVDGLMSNRPDLLLDVLRSRGS
jgi:glycerophosphoryl diester phosphodiesterase